MLEYFLTLVVLWAIFATAASVVEFLAHDAGFVHVGAAALIGIGAYTPALLVGHFQLNSQWALIAALPVGAAAGGAIHLLLCRLRAGVLALGTLAIGIVVHGVMLNATSFTGGPMGMALPSRLPVVGHEVGDVLLLLFVVIGLIAIVRRSHLGMRIRSLKEDETLAEDLGLMPRRLRAGLWVVSSSVLSMCGGLLAFNLRYIDPASFSVRESVGVLAMALLLPRPRGLNAAIGALAFIGLPEFLRFIGLPPTVGAELRQLVFGVALLVVISNPRHRLERGVTVEGVRA